MAGDKVLVRNVRQENRKGGKWTQTYSVHLLSLTYKAKMM